MKSSIAVMPIAVSGSIDDRPAVGIGCEGHGFSPIRLRLPEMRI
jgi:hypothetical protein